MNLRVITAAAVALFTVAALADSTYIVKEGDTLGGIAAKTGCKATSIAQYNGLKNLKALKVGKKLVIPKSSKLQQAVKPQTKTERTNVISSAAVRINRDYVVVRKGAKTTAAKITTVDKGTNARVIGRQGSWYKVQFAGGTTGYVRSDFLNAVRSAPVKFIQTSRPNGYRVVKNDTDIKICHKLGISPKALFAANPGVKWSRLQLGQVINNPGKAATTAKSHFAHGDKINYIATKYAKVNKEAVVVRSGPSTKKSKVTQVGLGKKAVVLGRSGAWYKVKFDGGTVGYIRGDFLNAAKPTPKPKILLAIRHPRHESPKYYAQKTPKASHATTYAFPSGPATDVVAEARRYIGTRYVWGGQSTRGFDCSGFVRYVYRRAEGVNLPRTSREQYHAGTAVSKSDLKPGDVLSFHTSGGSRVNHSGIYIGDGKFIHASSGKGRVRIDSLAGGYYANRLAGAHRMKGSLKKAKAKPAPPEEKKVITKEEPITSPIVETPPKDATKPEVKAGGGEEKPKVEEKKDPKGGGGN